jgi:anaerobic magnesium-protoporphyrin IX monomethyl ester cyclase
MRILAVHPIYPGNQEIVYLPLGLAGICAIAEREGHEVQVVDMHNLRLRHAALERVLQRTEFQVCLMGGFAMQVKEMAVVTRIVKRIQPRCHVIVGGVGVSVIPEVVLRYTGADAVSIGEAELTFPPVLRSLEQGRPYEDTTGFVYRDGDRIVLRPKGISPEDLDAIPWPSYHLFDVDRISRHSFNGRNGRSMHIMTSRGCPFKCDFCINSVLNSKTIMREIHGDIVEDGPIKSQRFRSMDGLVKEIAHLRSTYGINDFHFADEEFITNRRRLEEVCSAIEPLGITWSTSGRADWASEDKLWRMKKAGCQYVLFGVESGSQRMLDLMEKKAKLPSVSAGLRAAQRVGMDFIPNFMIGHPGETETTVAETVDFCREHRLVFLPAYVTLFPNSKMFHLVVKEIRDWDHYFDWLARIDFSRRFFMNLTELPDRTLKRLRNWAISDTMATVFFPWAKGALHTVLAWLLRNGLVISDNSPNVLRGWLRDILRYKMLFGRSKSGAHGGRQVGPREIGQEGASGEEEYEISLRELAAEEPAAHPAPARRSVPQ